MKKLNEPVLVAHYVAALVAAVIAVLVSHGVLTDNQASSLVQAVAPVATGVAVTALGWVTRHYVTPAWKLLEQQLLSTDETTPTVLAQSSAPRALMPSVDPQDFPDWDDGDLAAIPLDDDTHMSA